eukprot:UN22875
MNKCLKLDHAKTEDSSILFGHSFLLVQQGPQQTMCAVYDKDVYNDDEYAPLGNYKDWPHENGDLISKTGDKKGCIYSHTLDGRKIVSKWRKISQINLQSGDDPRNELSMNRFLNQSYKKVDKTSEFNTKCPYVI